MSFREKSNWVILAGILAVGGVYFGALAWYGMHRGDEAVALLIGAVLVQIAISVIGHVVIAMLDPKAAGRPLDERESIVELRAARIGYAALLTGALLAAGTIHLGFGRVGIANAVFGAVIVAEAVHYAAFLFLVRRPV